MRIWVCLFLLGVAVALQGCPLGHHYHKNELDTPVHGKGGQYSAGGRETNKACVACHRNLAAETMPSQTR